MSLEPIENVLLKFPKAKRAGKGWMDCCPSHDDKNPSLSIGVGDDGRVLLHCHSNGCDVKDIASAIGLEVSDLMPPRTNGNIKPSMKPTGDIMQRVEASKGLPSGSLNAYGAKLAKRTSKKYGREYDVVRIPLFNAQGVRVSYFDLTETGKGLMPEGGTHGLFLVNGKLPKPGETVLLTEGVKDAAMANSLGYSAVGLCTSNMAAKFAEAFRDCDIVIPHDLDQAGAEGAERSSRRLYGIAKSIRIARLPGEVVAKGGDDLRDIIKKFGADAVNQAIDSAPEWEPPKSDDRPLSVWQNENRTEAANGARLIAEAKTTGVPLSYCYQWRSYYGYSGSHWSKDESGVVESLAKRIGRKLWDDVDGIRAALDGATDDASIRKLKSLLADADSFARMANSARGIRATMDTARSEPGIPVSPEQFDSNPRLFNVANGTIDLQTGELRPHLASDYLTKISPVAYDADARCERWNTFLHEIMGGDDEMVRYLQRLAGCSISGEIRDHVLPILYGIGANGKSVFLNVMTDVFGDDYAFKAPQDLFTEDGRGSHPTGKAELFGRRFVVSNEIDEGRKLSEAWVKEATGGDPITARRMYQDFWTFAPTHTIWLATNHKPRVRGADTGIWRRLKLIPFNEKFEGDRADPLLTQKLREELPGILRWMVEGCIQWQSDGLGCPDVVSAATAEYRNDSDVVGSFVDECCDQDAGAWCRKEQMYEVYREWSEQAGEHHTMSKKAFGTRFAERGFQDVRRRDGRYWIGVQPISVDTTGFSSNL